MMRCGFALRRVLMSRAAEPGGGWHPSRAGVPSAKSPRNAQRFNFLKKFECTLYDAETYRAAVAL
jgi:hypothetical protein